MKNDAHNGDWKKYPITEHPRFGHKITTGSMIDKLNSKKDIHVEGIFHPPEIRWLTNPNESLHLHMDTTWACFKMLLQRQNPLIWKPYPKQGQALQKLTDNSGHMKTLGKCPIFSLVTMTPIIITMTQMLTSMKNSS